MEKKKRQSDISDLVDLNESLIAEIITLRELIRPLSIPTTWHRYMNSPGSNKFFLYSTGNEPPWARYQRVLEKIPEPIVPP